MKLIKNPISGKFKLPDGYKDLGWQRHSGNCEEIANCCKLGHNDWKNTKHWKEIDYSTYLNRGTHVIYICDECKIVWHIDMSD